METFSPGDRVVAINIDLSRPLRPGHGSNLRPFLFPDGQLHRNLVYHIDRTMARPDGHPGVYLCGLRVMWGADEVPWDASRFRKVQPPGNLKHPRLKKPALAGV
jgi:hypothetical protein